MGMSSILLFVIYPYRFCLFQHLIDIPGFSEFFLLFGSLIFSLPFCNPVRTIK